MLTFTRVLSVAVVFILLAVAAVSLTKDVEKFSNQAWQQQYARLVHSVNAIYSQWLIRGKPQRLTLGWQTLSLVGTRESSNLKINKLSARQDAIAETTNEIWLSNTGFPQLKAKDKSGCQRLWHDLLGQKLDENLKHELKQTRQTAITIYRQEPQRCLFQGEGGSQIIIDFSIEKLSFIEG